MLLQGTESSVSVTSQLIEIPNNLDALAIVSDEPVQTSLFEANELCVTLWFEKDCVAWYIGYFKSMDWNQLKNILLST